MPHIFFCQLTITVFHYPSSSLLPLGINASFCSKNGQKPNPNLLDRALYGFEGPIVLEEVPLPERMNKYAKYWQIDSSSSSNFSIVDNKFASGRKSLKFTHSGILSDNEVVALAPESAINISAGEFTLSMQVWLEPGSTIVSINPILEDPLFKVTPIDLTKVDRGLWVTVTQDFSRKDASKAGDCLRLVVYKDDVPGGKSTLYIDDIAIIEADK